MLLGCSHRAVRACRKHQSSAHHTSIISLSIASIIISPSTNAKPNLGLSNFQIRLSTIHNQLSTPCVTAMSRLARKNFSVKQCLSRKSRLKGGKWGAEVGRELPWAASAAIRQMKRPGAFALVCTSLHYQCFEPGLEGLFARRSATIRQTSPPVFQILSQAKVRSLLPALVRLEV